jgi:hypothetical protein
MADDSKKQANYNKKQQAATTNENNTNISTKTNKRSPARSGRPISGHYMYDVWQFGVV